MNPDFPDFTRSAGNSLHVAVVRILDDAALERVEREIKQQIHTSEAKLSSAKQRLENVKAEQHRRADAAKVEERRRLQYELDHAVLDERDARIRREQLQEQIRKLAR